MESNLENALFISLVGAVTTVVCLFLFYMMIVLLNKFGIVLAGISGFLKSRSKKNAADVNLSDTKLDQPSETDLVLISAAIASTFGQKVIIRKIKFITRHH